jgi:hypothetical protein
MLGHKRGRQQIDGGAGIMARGMVLEGLRVARQSVDKLLLHPA